uniref:TTC5_OB domain-containing protein n=1 Tax=Heterorhabditis bacteriophora TaxID=37862 RepID=A0A1I7WXU9_HETBA
MNRNTVIVARIVAVVSHEDIVPLTVVACDSSESCLAITIYNCSPSFSFVLGDSIAVADPFVVETKDVILPSSRSISFRSIQVKNPALLSRNGVITKATQLAPATINFTVM